jgi:hypothetical protein
LGVIPKKAGALAAALLVVCLGAWPARSWALPAAAPVAATAAAESFGALDDMTDGMADKAGSPSRDPYINLEKYPDIWSSMLMLAGLAVGFVLGRWWHLLFGKRDNVRTA